VLAFFFHLMMCLTTKDCFLVINGVICFDCLIGRFGRALRVFLMAAFVWSDTVIYLQLFYHLFMITFHFIQVSSTVILFRDSLCITLRRSCITLVNQSG
jgi:hypothetical protein